MFALGGSFTGALVKIANSRSVNVREKYSSVRFWHLADKRTFCEAIGAALLLHHQPRLNLA